MDEVKNLLDYKVGHCVHQKDLTYQQNHNILRSFMFIKQKWHHGQADIFMTSSPQPPYPYK